jgi:hypothetical protein
MELWVLDASSSWKFEQSSSAILPTQNSTNFKIAYGSTYVYTTQDWM